MTMLLPDKPTGTLDADETDIILRSTLTPVHYTDPYIIRFIAAYMRCFDSKQAAREAGIDTRSGANVRAMPDVHLAISKLIQKSANKYGFTAEEVIERVKEVSSVDPLDFFNPDGSYRALADIPPEARRAIKKIKYKQLYGEDVNGIRTVVGSIMELELWDKMKAHELLGREKMLFKETKAIEHNVTHNMGSLLLESARRGQAAIEAAREVPDVAAVPASAQKQIEAPGPVNDTAVALVPKYNGNEIIVEDET